MAFKLGNSNKHLSQFMFLDIVSFRFSFLSHLNVNIAILANPDQIIL